MPVPLQPFDEALSRIRRQTVLPTSAGTYGLDQLSADIRERSFFSARVMHAQTLQRAKDLLDTAIAGGQADSSGNYIPGSYMDLPTFRVQMKEYLDSISYQPAEGQEGTLKDLTSDPRLEVIFKTNVEMAQGYGAWLQQQDPDSLDAYPAQELYRLEDRNQRRPWGSIWNSAIQRLGRSNTSAIPVSDAYANDGMFALVNDPIWTEISRFGLPYPPYDFNSGMWVRDVDRLQAEELGLLPPGAPSPTPETRGFNDDLQAPVEGIAPALQEALSAFGTIIDGVFHLSNSVLSNRRSRFETLTNNFNPGQPRDSLGRWVDANGGGLDERHNIARGLRAVRRSLRSKSDVQKAMYKKGIGQVDFEWGRPGHTNPNPVGETHTDGYGVSHIDVKHGRKTLLRLPHVIAKGKIRPHEDPDKRYVIHGNDLAVVGKVKKKSSWVVSSFNDPKRISKLEGR